MKLTIAPVADKIIVCKISEAEKTLNNKTAIVPPAAPALKEGVTDESKKNNLGFAKRW